MRLKEKLAQLDIILGSGSPRRKQLLQEMGINFRVHTTDTDETFDENLNPEEIVKYLAKKKAESFIQQDFNENTLIITADTIVDLKGEIIPKPNDLEEAKSFIRKLSGNKHTVLTGVCLKTLKDNHIFCSKTDVYFKNLSDSEIEDYVNNMQPLDKAGAYGVQEWIGYIGIERIDGSFYNVVGLPTAKLWQELKVFLKAE